MKVIECYVIAMFAHVIMFQEYKTCFIQHSFYSLLSHIHNALFFGGLTILLPLKKMLIEYKIIVLYSIRMFFNGNNKTLHNKRLYGNVKIEQYSSFLGGL